MKIRIGQSLVDFAIQHCGSAEAAIDVAIANGISVTDSIIAGTDLIVPSLSNKAVAAYFDSRDIVPATQLTETPGITIFDETFDETFS